MNEPLHIALVTETFPPEVNGVAMTLGRLVEGTARRGHRVDVIRPRQHKGDAEAQADGIHQAPVPGVPLPRYQGLKMGLPARGRLLRRWRADRPDVVHIATEGPLGLTALMAARKLDIPISSGFHTNFHQYGKHYGYGPLLRGVVGYLRWVHNRTGCTMVPSEQTRGELDADGFKRIVVVSRGVDTELFGPHRRDPELRQQWGAGEEDLVCGYIGRVAGEKDIPLSIEAYRRIAAKVPSAKMVIVGDGPARPGLEKKHPDLIYAGMQRGEDLARHYASCDCFLFGSVTETFGNVVTEGMASGLCVLAYDYAAPGRFIDDGVNGLLAEFENREAFLAGADRIADDPAIVSRLGAAARETVADLGWDRVVDTFEAALREVATDGSVAP